MKFHPTRLSGVFLVELEKRGDDRGFFARTFCEKEFAAQGLETRFVQQNASRSALKGTLRGMHFQRGADAEAKLVRCVRGAMFDVVVDLRPDSPSFRAWEGFEITADDHRMVYAPPGTAHGYMTLTDEAEVSYLVSAFYAPGAEGGVRWNDPAFNIVWPLAPTVLSDKDQNWPNFED